MSITEDDDEEEECRDENPIFFLSSAVTFSKVENEFEFRRDSEKWLERGRRITVSIASVSLLFLQLAGECSGVVLGDTLLALLFSPSDILKVSK